MISRRRFTAAAGTGLALTVLGCGKEEPKRADLPKQVVLATEPFTAGPIAQYAAEGVYDQHYEDTGIVLVSDGKILVAINTECTHNGCLTRWKPEMSAFDCGCHGSKFDAQGINQPNMKATRPLRRCAIERVDSDSSATVRVDPTKMFAKDKEEWSDPASFLDLA